MDLAAVGPQDLDGQGHAGDGRRPGVAQQGRELNRLAGPVDAAIAVEEGVDLAGQVPAGDAARAEIEGRAGQGQEVEIAAPAPGRQVGRLVAAATAEQSGREAGHAPGVGPGGGEHGVVAGDQLQADAGQGLRRFQRAREDAQPVAALQGHQAQVRDQQPLGRQALPAAVLLLLLGRARDQHVEAFAAGIQRFLQGDLRDDLGVLFRLDPDAAFPDQGAQGGLDLVGAVAGKILAHQVRQQGPDQAPLVDVVEPEADLVDVHRLERQPLAARLRQDVALAGEADPRPPVGDGQASPLRLLQHHSGRRRQARLDLETVAPAVAQAAEAEPLAPGRDVDVLRRFEGDVVGRLQGQRLAQLLREHDAGARHGVVALDVDRDDAQLQPFDQDLQASPVLAVGEDLLRLGVEVDRGPVLALPQVDLGQDAEGARAAKRGPGRLVAQVGRRRGVLQMAVSQIGLRQVRPVGCAPAVADRSGLFRAEAAAPEGRRIE